MKIETKNKKWTPVTIEITIENESDALALFNLYNLEHRLIELIGKDIEYLDFGTEVDLKEKICQSLSQLLGGMYCKIYNI